MADQDSITTPANARPVDELARLAALRGSIERGLEAMLELLDALDGDPELEDGNDAEPDNDDEPTLGWGAHASQTHLGAFGPAAALDGELEEDDPPEPSLASPERHPNTYGNGVTSSGNQLHWADGAHSGGKDDCEEENEHGGDINDEPQLSEGDDEPSLGAPENPEGDQTRWGRGDREDKEMCNPVEEDPTIVAAARKRLDDNWGKAGEAGREAAEQLARMRGDKAPFASGSNVRVIAIGPDGMRYLVQGL